jgi:hypothetical protein
MELLTYASISEISNKLTAEPDSLTGKSISDLKNEHGLGTFTTPLELDPIAREGLTKLKADANFSTKSKLVWKALGPLDTAFAKDQRTWISLVFGPMRNLAIPQGSTKEEKIDWIRKNWFAKTYREYARHAIGKYWWTYEVARRQSVISTDDALDLFDYQQDLRGALVDRTSTNINSKVVGAVLKLVKQLREEGESYNRKRVRDLLKSLNFDIARRELEALPDELILDIMLSKWEALS